MIAEADGGDELQAALASANSPKSAACSASRRAPLQIVMHDSLADAHGAAGSEQGGAEASLVPLADTLQVVQRAEQIDVTGVLAALSLSAARGPGRADVNV